METTKQHILKAALLPAVAVLALAGCSGTGAVAQSEVEATTADQLEAMAGSRPNIDCPGDLDAEVGATMDCVLSVDGDQDEYLVTLTVSSVEDGTANWDIQVAETPM